MLSLYAPDKFSIFVTNLQRSIRFYHEILGFPKLWENPDAGNAGFRAGNNILIVQQNPQNVSKGGFRPPFTVDNLEELRHKLMAADIECSEIEDYGSFEHVKFSDPDGHLIGLLKPKPHYVERFEGYLGRKLFAES